LSGAPATFIDLNALAGRESLTGSVSTAAPSQFYRFTTAAPGVLDLLLSGMSANANLRLLDAAGDTIGSSSALGTQNDHITATTVPGTYFAQVSKAAAPGTSFSLRLTADYAGNIPPKARAVGAFSGRVFFDDYLGASPLDNHDYYAFRFNRAGAFTAVVTSPGADLTLSLARDSNGNHQIDPGETIITSAHNGMGVDESILNQPLRAGNYLVAIDRVSGESNYHLRLGADMAGNSLSAARNVGTLAGNQTFSDLVSSTDHDDFYKFTLAVPRTLRLDLSGLSAQVTLSLVNQQGSTILTQSNSPASNPPLIKVLNAGTFFVHVAFAGSDTTYTLSMSADSAGNTLGTARDLGDLAVATTKTINDSVDSNDPDDFYKFELSTPRQVDALLTNLSANADIQAIIDVVNPGTVDTGEVVISSTNGGTNFDEIAPSFAPGTYFLHVFSVGGAATNYQLHINTSPASAPDDRGGDSASNPKAIGTLASATQTFVDFVGNADGADVYRFDLAHLSTIDLQLDGLTANADLQLFTVPLPAFSPETLISSSVNSGALPEEILQTVTAGTYFLRVQHVSGDTYYRLRMTVIEEDGAGDTAADARNLGLLSNVSFDERIGGPDRADFYKFHVNVFTHTSIVVSGLTTADADLQLLDANQNVLTTSAHAGAANESIVQNLVPGTYFVLVSPRIGEGPYHIAFTHSSVADGAGSTLATAHNLGTLHHGTDITLSDYVGPDDLTDIFKLTIPNGSNVAFTFNPSISGVQTFLVQDRNGDGQIQSSEKFFAQANLVPGTYFLVVQRSNSTGVIYHLHLTVNDIEDGGGNTLATAFNLGTIGQPQAGQQISGYVGFDDTVDLFKFSVGPLSTIHLTLNHLVNDADLFLLDSNGKLLATSDNGGTTPEQIDFFTLFGGTFFIKIEPFGSANTTYGLSFST